MAQQEINSCSFCSGEKALVHKLDSVHHNHEAHFGQALVENESDYLSALSALMRTCNLYTETEPSLVPGLLMSVKEETKAPIKIKLKRTDAKRNKGRISVTGVTRPHHCNECKLWFSGPPNQHIARVHIKRSVVACSRCTFTHFWQPGAIKKHIKRHHGGRAKIIDNRHKILEEVERFRAQFIVTCIKE